MDLARQPEAPHPGSPPEPQPETQPEPQPESQPGSRPESQPGPQPRSWTLVWAAVFVVAGAVLARELGLLVAALCCTVAILAAVRRRQRRARLGPWLLIVPAALAAAVAEPSPRLAPRGVVGFGGVVQPGVRWDPVLRQESLRLRHGPREFLCILEGRRGLLPGDRVTGTGRTPAPAVHPRPLPRVLAANDALQVTRGRPSPARFADACRLAMQDALLAAVPGERGRLLCHLVLGSGPGLPPDLTNAHRATGVSHLLAVSGAHATMLAIMLALLFRVGTGRAPLSSRRYRQVAFVILILYGGITGMEPPVFRALVATLVFFAAAAHDRRPAPAAILAVPAILTAVLMPRDLFSVSFNLSYAAVLGLMLSGAFWDRRWHRRLLWAPLWGSCWATVLTMPLTLWYFGQYAPWTILLTPLLGPLVAMMLGMGLCVGTVGALAPGATGPLIAMGWPLDAITFVYCETVRLAAHLPLAPVYAATRPDALMLCSCGFFGLAVVAWRRDRFAIAGLCLLLSLPHFLPATTKPQANLQLLAVGHGQACLGRLPDGSRVLVDCGSLGNPVRAVRAVVDAMSPRRRLDLLVLSHGDFDHVGGVPELLARVPVARAVLPAEMRNSDVAMVLAQNDVGLTFLAAGEQLQVTPHLFLFRPAEAMNNRNDQSIWTRVELQGCSVLLPADALEDSVQAVLAHQPPTCDVLLLPHHGREHGAAPALLRALRPKLALVSSARKDGRSSQASVARQFGIQTLHTGLRGNITISGGDPPTVATELPLEVR